MKRFRQKTTRVVYGWREVEAANMEEARELFEEGDFDEFDNKSCDDDVGEIEEHEGCTPSSKKWLSEGD